MIIHAPWPEPTTFLELAIGIANDCFQQLAYTSFLWIPIVFVAYAIGRKRVGLRFIFVFTAVEALAVLIALWMYHGGWESL